MKKTASLYRVEFILPITNERQLWNNYLNPRDAEEAAYGLITSGHAVETEVFIVATGGHKTSIYHARRERDGAILLRRNSQ
ncbi:MAG: hypothetical protein ACREAM_07360 [Blastocatellia bacterium]